MEVVKVNVEHPKKGTTPYEGVRLNALLDQAKLKPDATKMVLTASDGFTAEVAWPTSRKCADCLIGFGAGGKLNTAMPGMQTNLGQGRRQDRSQVTPLCAQVANLLARIAAWRAPSLNLG